MLKDAEIKASAWKKLHVNNICSSSSRHKCFCFLVLKQIFSITVPVFRDSSFFLLHVSRFVNLILFLFVLLFNFCLFTCLCCRHCVILCPVL